MAPLLNEIFNTLTRYDDTQITVSVTTRESGNAREDLRLSQERGRAIIARAVSQGIDFSRLSLDAAHGTVEDDFDTSHTVKIKALSSSKSATQ
ncbi:MAG: hypothetical protein AB8B64_15795 [Granulosicoccus sp.]